ncbi:hypothetical protein BCR39DRAFT_538711 [Naematelia encephala]|uniref:Uncharacterized protein n=1 Tax=Naematelia encephala TaxID=71784 RepID=A0A1Y2AX73_9TREE|nr:hypothetical protein BCR39DRAFT_538711 [Naematelia encephala]
MGDGSAESFHTSSTTLDESQAQMKLRRPGENVSTPGSQESTLPSTPAESPILPSFIINMLSTYSKPATSPSPQASPKVGGQYQWTSTNDLQVLVSHLDYEALRFTSA